MNFIFLGNNIHESTLRLIHLFIDTIFEHTGKDEMLKPTEDQSTSMAAIIPPMDRLEEEKEHVGFKT